MMFIFFLADSENGNVFAFKVELLTCELKYAYILKGANYIVVPNKQRK